MTPYHYHQIKGGEEEWHPIPATMLDTVKDSRYVTILSVDTPVSKEFTKEQYADLKYKGPLYFDLDDAESPASTAVYLVELIDKLVVKGVDVEALSIYASGGKGFHLLVPETYFLTKPPAKGMAYLPAIYKEIAFNMAVDSMDMRVYTAKRGRMFRQENVLRENGRYKVQLAYAELKAIASLAQKSKDSEGDEAKGFMLQAEDMYKDMCSKPREVVAAKAQAKLSAEMVALFDLCKAKVTKAAAKIKKMKPIKLPNELPSFEAMLRGEGIKTGTGFHLLAMQIAITAHAKNMTQKQLLDASAGLCNSHESDGGRYNSPSKRRAELARMWEYTEDNPCYAYSPMAIAALCNHAAPDLRGIEVPEEEVLEGIQAGDEGAELGVEEGQGEFDHAGIVLSSNGAYVTSDAGPRKVTAMSFGNVVELISAASNTVTELQAEIKINGANRGSKVLSVDTFSSVGNLNKMMMPFGQSFNGTDVHSRGMFMRLVERARKARNRMYVVNREGLDIVNIPFHDSEVPRKDFMIWSDSKLVVPEPRISNEDVKLKFVGFPMEAGQFQTDLSQAPNLHAWVKEGDNKERLRKTVEDLLHCQKPHYLGKLLGWMVACNYRMLFHKLYNKFPLLHINGAAGAGKTEITKLMSNFHYYLQEPKMLSPTSTLFAVQHAASGSASIPLILDEFKPSEMSPQKYDQFKLMLRDAYNCRNVERGGGNRENSDYRAVHVTQLSAPLCFIAEAAESESALMERVVLLTLVKPPVIQAQRYLMRFQNAVANKEVLGIIGCYLAAQIVRKYSLEEMQTEFNELYAESRKELMLQEGEEGTLSKADLERKSGAKERVVFNYSVARFGLRKFRELMFKIYGSEFDPILQEMDENMFTTVTDLQQQTLPEWLKVMNTFADMAQADPMSPQHLKDGVDYAYTDYGGKIAIELYARNCYFKYRVYCTTARMAPLFPSESAFVYALQNLPAFMARGINKEITPPGGSHMLDLDELRGLGFIEPVNRRA